MSTLPLLTLSFMDRLREDVPDITRGDRPTWYSCVRALKESVRDNLIALLNTRRLTRPVPEEFQHCANSLLAFGLPEFTSLNISSTEDDERLRSAIESTINQFEPRLTGVIVTPQSDETAGFEMHYRIDAWLQIEPAPEPITFDTLFESDKGHFVVVDSR